jgi:hypothetical protein
MHERNPLKPTAHHAIVEIREAHARKRWHRVSPAGITGPLDVPPGPVDLVLVGEGVALQAIFRGRVCPDAAAREGQIEAFGSREALHLLMEALAPAATNAAARAA